MEYDWIISVIFEFTKRKKNQAVISSEIRSASACAWQPLPGNRDLDKHTQRALPHQHGCNNNRSFQLSFTPQPPLDGHIFNTFTSQGLSCTKYVYSICALIVTHLIHLLQKSVCLLCYICMSVCLIRLLSLLLSTRGPIISKNFDNLPLSFVRKSPLLLLGSASVHMLIAIAVLLVPRYM